MKKYFLMLATITAALFVSCENKDDNKKPGPDGPDTPTGKTVLSEAVYYGEKLGEKVGYYSMTFTNGDDKLRLDLFASVASDPDKAKILGGTYDLGTLEEPVTKTYFVAENGTDEVGTLFWSNGTPVLVTGGEVTVQVAAGGYAVNIALTAGDQKIEWKYSGTITFINKYESAPYQERIVDAYSFEYQGEYTLSANPLGLMRIILVDQAHYPNHGMQLFMTIPVPNDPDNVTIPTGTFEVVKDPQEPYKILAGYVENNNFVWSFEREVINNVLKGVLLVSGGTVTISNEGGKFLLTTDLTCNIANPANGTVTGSINNVVYTLDVNETPTVVDLTRPESNLETDIVIEDYPNIFGDVWNMDQAGTQAIWRFVMSTKDLTISKSPSYESDQTLQAAGEGKVVIVQFISKGEVESPAGVYEMNNAYNSYKIDQAIPGSPGIGDILQLFGGVWYSQREIVDGEYVVTDMAGAVAGKGSVTVTDENNVLTFTIDFYDKYDHNISGTVSYTLASDQAAQFLSTEKAQPKVAYVGNFRQYSVPFAL